MTAWSIEAAGFDAVAMEVSATLVFFGMPRRDALHAIIEGYRPQVVQSPTS